MSSVVLITFAGRRERMEILTNYVRRAMDIGLIDEWHIWDFTRSREDREWVTKEFGPVRYMHADVPYMHKGNLSATCAFRMEAVISRDLHIAMVPNDQPDGFYEIVVGGWDNQQSVIRKLSIEGLENFDRNEQAFWVRATPGALSLGSANDVVLTVDDDGTPTLYVNDVHIGSWPNINLSQGASIKVRGGYDADLELVDVDSPVRRYVGEPDEKFPYYRAYDYYAKNLKEFSDVVFLKCDDDIVYMDLDKLSAYIDFRRKNPNYLVVSANVVNNPICAYWQQAAGSLPLDVGLFEYPKPFSEDGLWRSAEQAERVHNYFLQKKDKRLPLPSPVVDSKDRISINFISWLGRDLKHMGIRRIIDERALTVDLPAFLNRPICVFSDFTVSHLSFGAQEAGLDATRLIAAYRALMLEKLGSV